jgi:UDP-glucose 4-epimerase
VLAQALIGLFGGTDNLVETIGFRHGEKLFESLLSSEEKATAEDLGDYFRVPLDSRDLNYKVFFEEGVPRASEIEPYTSHNTERLGVEAVKELLLQLPEIREELRL